MKDSTEQMNHINESIESYLKRRNYQLALCEKNEDKDEIICKDKFFANFILNELILKENPYRNLSLISPNSLEQSLLNLKKFFSEKVVCCTYDFDNLYGPLFCHVYLELLNSKDSSKYATKLIQRNPAFCKKPKYTLDEPPIMTLESLKNRSQIEQFRSSKCIVKICPHVISKVQHFFQNFKYIPLIQVLNKWFVFEVAHEIGINRVHPKLENVKKSKHVSTFDLKSSNEKDQEIKITYKKIIEKSKRIFKNYKCDPIALLSVNNHPIMRTTSCCFTTDCKYVAANFNNKIRIWQACYNFSNYSGKKQRYYIPSKVIRYSQTFSNFDAKIYAMQFIDSSNQIGNLLAIASNSGLMNVWDVQKGECIATYKGHSMPIWDISMNKIGLHIATASRDLTAKLWSLERTFPIRSFAGHTHSVDCLGFHPNCLYIGTGSTDKTVRMWNVNTGKLVRIFNESKGPINALNFSPNGYYIAAGGEDKQVRIWDLRSKSKILEEFKAIESNITSLSFSPCSKYVICSAMDGIIRCYDMENVQNRSESNNHNFLQTYKTETDKILSLKYNDDLLFAFGVYTYYNSSTEENLLTSFIPT